MTALWIIVLCGALAIVYAIWATQSVMKADAGSAKMQEIAAAIQEGAQAYLRRQYTTIAMVGVVIFLIVGLLPRLARRRRLPDRRDAVRRCRLYRHECFGAGQCAHGPGRDRGPRRRPRLAFRSGAVTGMLVAGLAPARASPATTRSSPATLQLATNDRTVIDALVALGFGASLISIFARLGGGIFTKGADVGGDMVGKVEAGIPEDDPRNAATIADNVGDNVGDCAGMAADLFETYAVTTVATMVLAAIFFGDTPIVVPMMSCRSRSAASASSPRSSARSSSGCRQTRTSWARSISGLIVTGVLSLERSGVVIISLVGLRRPARRRQYSGTIAVHLRHRRAGRDRPDRLDHRILHRHGLPAGEVDRQSLGHRARHQRHPGPGHLAGVDRAAGHGHHRRHHRHLHAGRACSASPSPPPPCCRWPA